VCHTLALPFTLKSIFKAKEKLWEFQYFTLQKYNLQKKSSKRNQNPSRYHNSKTNLKFQHKPKVHIPKSKVQTFPEINKGCVTLWPCHFTLKSIFKGKQRIMEIQISHHAKV
jgi:hypothetical protein